MTNHLLQTVLNKLTYIFAHTSINIHVNIHMHTHMWICLWTHCYPWHSLYHRLMKTSLPASVNSNLSIAVGLVVAKATRSWSSSKPTRDLIWATHCGIWNPSHTTPWGCVGGWKGLPHGVSGVCQLWQWPGYNLMVSTWTTSVTGQH